MNIRILSQYYPPDTATTGILLHELTAGLRARGHSIEVFTAQPTYSSELTAAPEEKSERVNIFRVWSTRMDKNSMLGKVLNSLTFVVSVFLRLLLTRDSSSPLLIVSNPPFLPIVGLALRVFRKIPFIFLVHDVYPDIAIRLGYLRSDGFIQWYWNRLNSMILRASSHVVVLSEAMKKIVVKKMILADVNDPDGKISIIHNWARGEVIRPVGKADNLFLKRHAFSGKFIVQYSGNMGLFHGLENVIEAAAKIDDPDFIFLFIGDGGKKTRLEKMVSGLGLSNVMFLPFQDSSILAHSLSAADVAIVSLEEGIDGLAMPSKLYPIMASGTPILAFCDPNSDIANILSDAHSGFVFRHNDVAGFVGKLKHLTSDRPLLDKLKSNARRCFEERFGFEKALSEYEKVILSLK